MAPSVLHNSNQNKRGKNSMAKRLNTARSKRMVIGTTRVMLASLLLTTTAKATTEKASIAGKHHLVTAAQTVESFVNKAKRHLNFTDLLRTVADHPEFKGMIINGPAKRILLTTKEWSPKKEFKDYCPLVEIIMTDDTISMLHTAVQDCNCRNIIKNGNGRVYTALSALQEIAAQQQTA